MGLFKAMILLGAVLLPVCLSADGRDTTSEEFKKMRQLLRGYTKEPQQGLTNLSIGIYINNIFSISDQSMEYTMSLYLRQKWIDKRLEFEPFNGEREQTFLIPDGLLPQIWTPDVFFRNEKKAGFHSVTVPNRLMRLSNNGSIWYVVKLTATLSCPMRLQKFPMDSQSCPLMIESFGLKTDQLKFGWLDSPVDVDPGVQLPQFTLKDMILHDCSQNYSSGTFPCLSIDFQLTRDSGFYIMQIYIPSVLIVILSWVAFWVAIECIAARVGIGLTALVTIAILSAWSRSKLPVVSYTTCMDIWMSICYIFVFASFLEFAAVHFLSRKEAQNARDEESSGKPEKETSVKDAFRCDRKRTGNSIDVMSRIIFPVAFVLFNIIYWPLFAIPME